MFKNGFMLVGFPRGFESHSHQNCVPPQCQILRKSAGKTVLEVYASLNLSIFHDLNHYKRNEIQVWDLYERNICQGIECQQPVDKFHNQLSNTSRNALPAHSLPPTLR